MRSFVWATFVGILGAGIVHIVVLMLVPHVSERGAWSQLAAEARPDGPTPVDGRDGGVVIRPHDPAFLATACLFDLSDGFLRVTSDGPVPFWSASVYDRNGSSLMAVNDTSAPQGLLDLVVLSADQLIELRREQPGEMERSVLAETSAVEGIVVVRALVPDPSWAEAVRTFMDELRCQRS